MFRNFLIVAVSVLAVTASSAADFSTARCEDPKFIQILDGKLKATVVEGGNALSSYGAFVGGITRSTTALASQNKLVCDVSLDVTSHGESSALRVRVAVQQFSSGKTTIKWSVN